MCMICETAPCHCLKKKTHCIPLPNGNYQVGVHIANVTHYVQAGSAMRSTSTYLVNKRLDTLPLLLMTDLCSLNGNVGQYVIFVLCEVTPNADIIHDFCRTIIHSIGALTNGEAQAINSPT
jgi:exosome complex exonuclease DIS3/RRP44